ncbi:MAG: tetratricopeptide repeat protein, partial [Myxococcota bacterium]|nr:tetratricopeptide repeat protein [Myxococcota bacterium]
VDAAIAEGRDLAAADRVRAMAYLAKGDPARAMEVFERLARNTAREPRARARSALTLAWIRLHSGDATEAIRAALEALALVRRLKDPRERVSLNA